MKFVKGSEDLKVNTFYMNYMAGDSSIYAFYLTDEEFKDHNCGDEVHYKVKPLYNCKEIVAVSLTYEEDPNEEDETLVGDFMYELTEQEGLLIGDLFN